MTNPNATEIIAMAKEQGKLCVCEFDDSSVGVFEITPSWKDGYLPLDSLLAFNVIERALSAGATRESLGLKP